MLILGVAFRYMECIFEYILKIVLGRPRPRETIGLAKEDDECMVEYTGFLVKFVGENPCDMSFFSCPSGHALETTMMMIMAIYTIRYY